MGKYCYRFATITMVAGRPSSRRNLWLGYELVGRDGDLRRHGLYKPEEVPADELARIKVWDIVRPGDVGTLSRLGIKVKKEEDDERG